MPHNYDKLTKKRLTENLVLRDKIIKRLEFKVMSLEDELTYLKGRSLWERLFDYQLT
jgi:hypothetical protein